MKSKFHILVLSILILGFVGIQLATIIDDPSHIAEPDPDCPICIAAQTSAYLDINTSFNFTLDFLLFLNENSALEPHTHNYISLISIRAPPCV